MKAADKDGVPAGLEAAFKMILTDKKLGEAADAQTQRREEMEENGSDYLRLAGCRKTRCGRRFAPGLGRRAALALRELTERSGACRALSPWRAARCATDGAR